MSHNLLPFVGMRGRLSVRVVTESVIFKSAISTLILVLGTLSAFAQQRDPARGLQFANSYASNGFDAINVSNGNLLINLPLASLPAGRGTSPGFTVTLQYNSKIWDSRQTFHTDAIQGGGTGDLPPAPTYSYTTDELVLSNRGGWRILSGYRLIETNRLNLEDPDPCLLGHPVEKLRAKWKMEVEFPDGSVRQFIPTYHSTSSYEGYYNIDSTGRRYWASIQTGPNGLCYVAYSETQATTAGMHYITTDGSRMRLFVPYQGSNWKIFSADGTVVENAPPDDSTVSQRLTDRNGNEIEIKGNQIVDQLGRTITIGGGGVTVQGYDGASVTTQIVFGTRWVYRKYQVIANNGGEMVPEWADRWADLRTAIPVVEQVVLPAQMGGQSYTFDYYADTALPAGTDYTEGWGAIKSATLPSGATATYTYTLEDGRDSDTAADVLADHATQRDLTYTETYGGNTTRTETSHYSTFPGTSSVSNPDGSGMLERSFFSTSGGLGGITASHI